MAEDSPESKSDRSDVAGSTFEDFVFHHFGRDPRPGFTSPIAATGVVLCFVNRSGSNFLAECLASSGHLPRAREFFLKRNLLSFQETGADLSSIFEAIVEKHTVNGIFATKFGFAQLAFFDSHEFLDSAFARTKFIHLIRRDFLGQAISLEIASQNRRWKSGDEPSGDRDLQYSRKRIELKMRGIQKKHEQFEAFFAARHLTPFLVDHNDLVAHPAETVAEVGDFLDCPIRFDPKMDHSKKSRDPFKEAWKRRFLERN